MYGKFEGFPLKNVHCLGWSYNDLCTMCLEGSHEHSYAGNPPVLAGQKYGKVASLLKWSGPRVSTKELNVYTLPRVGLPQTL